MLVCQRVPKVVSRTLHSQRHQDEAKEHRSKKDLRTVDTVMPHDDDGQPRGVFEDILYTVYPVMICRGYSDKVMIKHHSFCWVPYFKPKNANRCALPSFGEMMGNVPILELLLLSFIMII